MNGPLHISTRHVLLLLLTVPIGQYYLLHKSLLLIVPIDTSKHNLVRPGCTIFLNKFLGKATDSSFLC